MNIFEQYGIKEVADVLISSIHRKEDGSGDVYYLPALYLDTLKVSTTEQTADNTWAQGGFGNSRLVSWDYNKAINLTLEDALCSPASLGLCWGGILSSEWKNGQVNIKSGFQDMSCGTERIVRFVKEFYPRNDTINAVVSNLLPRDGQEDIFLDQHGDPVYLERSSILDGVNIKGFGYVSGKPYKWNLEIETSVKSIAVVPDRFFSIYGKSYPIKRRQTVGINQPSELFKYEIVYLRGYDKYDDEQPQAKIIYHSQNEGRPKDDACAAKTNEDAALKMLDDYVGYPYLKLRVCLDGYVRAYLGTPDVDWDLTRQIEDDHATPDINWVEIPQINTEQFRGIDLWLRFDSINALSYYLITKYENNIFDIGPKDIKGGLENRPPLTYYKVTGIPQVNGLLNANVTLTLKEGATYKRREVDTSTTPITYGEWETVTVETEGAIANLKIDVPADRNNYEILSPTSANSAVLEFINTNPTRPYTNPIADPETPGYDYDFSTVTEYDVTGSVAIAGATFT